MYDWVVFDYASVLLPPATPTPSVPVFSITYWWYEINDNLIYFSSIKYMKNKNVKYDDQQYINEWSIYNIQEWEKTIMIRWVIKQYNRQMLINEIDLFKKAMLKANQTLIIQDGTTYRKAKCVCTWIELSEDTYNLARMDFNLEFTTYEYLQDTTFVTDTQNNIASDYNFTITKTGTAEARIYTTITMNSWNLDSLLINIDTVQLTIYNISSWDVIIIDWYETKITKNWSEIWFDGMIPKLKNDTCNISLDGTSTGTYDYNFVTQYYPAYK